MNKSLFAVAVLVAALFPAPQALAAPTIAFLNPSGYTTPPPAISDVQDADGSVHLVAWAKEVPSPALVEFEIQPAGQNAATFTASRVGNDTWEAFLPIPDTYPDGAGYTLRARLYQGVPGDADEVANTEMTVEVDQSEVPPPRGETVELTYPRNGDGLGFFVPKGKRPVAVFDYAASVDTERIRAFYTTSAPGTAPVWQESCGSAVPDDQGLGKVRCILEAGHRPLDVTAVALVSNKTSPPSAPNPQLDDTGDAHRVFPYLQQPSSVEINQGNMPVNVSACHVMTMVVNDQFDRAVAGTNVDVHAEGPGDELNFGTRGTGSGGDDTDPFQPPDSGHVSRENAKRCSDNANLNQQGDHNSPERDDVKHIESVDGTSDGGAFHFALRSDFAGGTFIQAWADVDDDDLPDLNEASGGTQLGWGSPPPPPRLEVFVTPKDATGSSGSCVAFEIVARRGGSPFNNANVDIHLQGPDPGVAFCDVSGGSPRRPPESGGHLADAHEDGTRHGEGEADASGRFSFGVRSSSAGTTQVQVWIDVTDDDLLSAEPSQSATVTWLAPGDRTISIASNRNRIQKGRRVRLSGRIEGDAACSADQRVVIQSKRVRGDRFAKAKTVTTGSDGSYSARVRMRASKRFRAVAPPAGACSKARSRTITVRVR